MATFITQMVTLKLVHQLHSVIIKPLVVSSHIHRGPGPTQRSWSYSQIRVGLWYGAQDLGLATES